jgi:copper transport protein
VRATRAPIRPHSIPLFAGVALLALLCVVGFARPAKAHAVLLDASPGFDEVVNEQPDRVVANFSEPVEINFGALRVFDSNAERVDTDDSDHVDGDLASIAVGLRDDLADGTYTATYRVISADAHVIDGAFVFHLGAAGPQSEGIGDDLLSGEGGSGRLEQVLLGFARWANFSGLLLLAGAVFFAVVIWRRPTGSLAERPEDVETAFGARWRTMIAMAWWIVLTAGVVMFLLQGAVAADLPLSQMLSFSLIEGVAGTRFGIVSLAKLALLVAGAGIWFAVRRSSLRASLPVATRRSSPSVGAAATNLPLPGWLLGVVGVLLLILLATPGLAGHAGATSPAAINIPADIAHMVGVAAWLGGLVTLLVAAYPSTRSLDDSDRAEILSPVVRRFSAIAIWSVAIIVVTGVIRSWLELDSLSALWEESWGRVLLTKVGVFVPLVALGAVNNRIVGPRLEANSRIGGLSRVRKLIGFEVALGVAVVALTAWLVGLSPTPEAGATEAPAGPYETVLDFGEGRLDVLIDPTQVGDNSVHLTATNDDGSPFELKRMSVEFALPERDVGPLIAKGRELSPGHFVVEGNQLSIPGEWTVTFKGRADKFTQVDANTTVELER